jgi:hypothetical protein
MNEFKTSIIQTLPDDRSEISWGIDELGKIIFKDNWNKIPQMVHSKFSPTIYDIFQVIQNNKIFPDENDKYELYIYLMNKLINKLL